MDPTQLNTLIEMACNARDAAASRLGRLEQQVRQAREHMQTLEGYSQDYAARLQARAGDTIDPIAQQNQLAFLGKLRVALETQQREVAARQQASAAAAGELALCQRKVKSLETLVERQARAHQQRTARREQRQTDEIAQRSAMRLSGAAESAS